MNNSRINFYRENYLKIVSKSLKRVKIMNNNNNNSDNKKSEIIIISDSDYEVGEGEKVEETTSVVVDLESSGVLTFDASLIDWDTFEFSDELNGVCDELEEIRNSWFGEEASKIPLNKEIKKKKHKTKKLTLYDDPMDLMTGIPRKARRAANMGRGRGIDCKEPGCTRNPTHNYEGYTVPFWCRKHALVNMINVRKLEQYDEVQPRPIAPRVIETCDHGNGRTCKEPAYFGDPVIGYYYCKRHKHTEHIMDPDDIHPCGISGCDQPALYSYTGHCKLFCRKHKKIDMQLFKPKSG